MRAADRSAQRRTGRVLPGPRSRIIAIATGLGLLLLQPGALAAEPLFDATPKGESTVLTIGEQMELEATLPAAQPPADPTAPAPDPNLYRYEWNLDADPELEKADTGEAGRKFTDVVGVDQETAPPYYQTVHLRVIDTGGQEVYSEMRPLAVEWAPDAMFVFSAPEPQPRAGQKVTFTSEADDKDGDLDPTSLRWFIDGAEDVQNRGQRELTKTFPTSDDYEIEHRVKDSRGRERSFTRTVSVAPSPPVARFVFSPSAPTTDDTVQFDGRASSDPDSSSLTFAWVVDGREAGDQPTLARRFTDAGQHTVALRVRDESGQEDVMAKTFTVKAVPVPPPPPNAAPKASMLVAPRDPEIGQTVTLTSTATDSDGRISKVQWDVNNDGQFSDGGTVATTSFSTPGNHTVALKVFDDDGASATAFETVTVKARAEQPKVTTKRMLNPFPVVRIRGVMLRHGVRVQVLSVRAAPPVRISVRCKGRGCPRKQARTFLTKGGGLRIRAFERTLRAGIVLEVRVTWPGFIGKYTKFTIRRRAAPRRVDLCMGPGSTRPVKCAA